MLSSAVEGGPAIWLILLIGVIGIAVTVERFYVVVVRARHQGRPFIERVIQLVRGGKIDEALKACASSTAALPDIGLLILRSRSRDEHDLQNIAAAARLHVLPKLTRRTHYLATLAVVAGLLGALGAARGIQLAFEATATTPAHDAAFWTMLARAMSPLVLALGVASLLTLARGYLLSQAEFITEEIEEFSARLVNALIDRPDVRLGHR